MKLESTNIGFDYPPFVIAEMSGNHNQSLEQALCIVEAAAKTGVNALKLQTYTADTMTLDLKDREFCINDPESLWNGETLYDLYQKAHTPWEWHKPIFERARKLGLIVFSTPFDETAVDFLEGLEVPCYKIASFENTDIPLIKKVSSTGKPLIISTGMATVAELDESIRAARECGARDIVLLKCTSTYPATPENSNLLTIPHMRELFSCEVGLSDHTMGIGAAIASVPVGATVIEKHFTINRADGGVDTMFSMEPEEMKLLVEETRRAWQSLGAINYGPTTSEKNSLIYRRSLYFIKNMKTGEKITNNHVRAIRPGFGLAPKYIDILIGRAVRNNTVAGTPVKWSNIS